MLALCVVSLLSCTRSGEPNDTGCEFGPGQSLDRVNSSSFDGSPTVSADETELFFTSERRGSKDLFTSTRSGKDAPWSEPVNLSGAIDDTTSGDFSLRLSHDGRELYFASNRAGGFGEADLYVAERASRQDPWGPAVNLGPRINTDAFEAFPTPSADGTSLYFNRSTGFDSQDSDIWVSVRAQPGDEWGVPQRLSVGINSGQAEFSPSISTDGNTLYFASARSGSVELWVSTRADRSSDWSAPAKLGPAVNVVRGMTLAPFISDDQQSLYFMSARSDSTAGPACTPRTCFSGVDLYVARRRCR